MVKRGRGTYSPASPSLASPRLRPGKGRIAEYRALAGLPRAADALALLVRVGEAVAPLLARHAWRLPLLAEMRPQERNLLGLNVNKGQKICLRLRPGARSDPLPEGLDTFLDFESIVQTMLHELTHNVRGPHDDVFWSTLQRLSDEHDSLLSAGPAALSFTEPGRRLGADNAPRRAGTFVQRGALDTARPQGMDSRQNRLGGTKPGQDVAAAAAAAAQRRIKQAGSCPESAAAAREAELEAEQDEARHGVEVVVVSDSDTESGDDQEGVTTDLSPRDVIEPPQSADDSIVCVDGPSEVSSRPLPSRRGERARASSVPAIVLDSGSEESEEEVLITGEVAPVLPPNGWTCAACTLRNRPSALRCAACDAPRPRLNALRLSARSKLLHAAPPSISTVTEPKAWQCSCGWVMAHENAARWMCTACGKIRTTS